MGKAQRYEAGAEISLLLLMPRRITSITPLTLARSLIANDDGMPREENNNSMAVQEPMLDVDAPRLDLGTI